MPGMLSQVKWGTGEENILTFDFPFDNIKTYRKWREGSSRVRIPGVGFDVWGNGRDYILEGDARWLSFLKQSDPVGVQAFIDWAADRTFSFVPDSTVPDFAIPGCFLIAPFEAPEPGSETSGDAIQRLVIGNPTYNFAQAMRGIMFEYAPGASLVDPIAYTTTRASAAGILNRSGSVESLIANLLRDRHYPKGFSGGQPILPKTTQLEPGATNVCLQSQAIATAPWNGGNATIANNVGAAPDGTITATSIIPTAFNGPNHYAAQGIAITANEFIADGVFVQASGYTGLRIWCGETLADTNAFAGVYDLTAAGQSAGQVAGTGAVRGTFIVPLGNGWYWCGVWGAINNAAVTSQLQFFVFPNYAMATASTAYAGDTVSGVRVWGAQQERNGTLALPPTSYVATGAGTATRSGDVFTAPYLYKPQSLFYLASFIERGSVYGNAGDGPGQIGGGGLPYCGFDSFANPGYRFTHQNANGAVAANMATLAANGDSVDLLGIINPNGSVQLIQSINGGAPVASGTSGALAFVPSWITNTLFVNRAAFRGAFSRVKVGALSVGGVTRDAIVKALAA